LSQVILTIKETLLSRAELMVLICKEEAEAKVLELPNTKVIEILDNPFIKSKGLRSSKGISFKSVYDGYYM